MWSPFSFGGGGGGGSADLTDVESRLTVIEAKLALIGEKAEDVASANTIDASTIDGDYAVLTGNTTVQGFSNLQAGRRIVFLLSGTPTWEHSADLNLPTEDDIISEVGDIVTVYADDSDTVHAQWSRATGRPLDYEEGTWTPGFSYESPGTFNAGTLGVQGGDYVRNGNGVAITARVQSSGITRGTANGSFVITGLPFPVSLSYVSSIIAAPLNMTGNAFSVTSSAIDVMGLVGFLTDGTTSMITGYTFRTISTGVQDFASFTPSNMADGAIAVHLTLSYITD